MAERDITLGLEADFNATALHLYLLPFIYTIYTNFEAKANARKELQPQ